MEHLGETILLKRLTASISDGTTVKAYHNEGHRDPGGRKGNQLDGVIFLSSAVK